MPRLSPFHPRAHLRCFNGAELTDVAALLLLAAAAIAAGPAQAAPIGVYTQYFVTGEASAASGSSTDATYRCNGGNGGAYADNLGGCVANLGSVPQVNTVTGTVDSSGRTRSFTADTTHHISHLEFPNGLPTPVLDPAFSRARASANLADASLHASVVNDSNNTDYVGGQALADLHDIVQLRVAGADASTRTRLNFSFAVDGLAYDSGKTTRYGEHGGGSLEARLLLNDLSSANDGGTYALIAAAGWSNFRGTFAPNTFTYDNRGDADLVGGSWVVNTLGLMQFDGWLDIIGAAATINPTLSLSVSCQIGLVCDYGNTAKFSFTGLPSSVSYSSDSGVFLTAAAAVPEPGTWALMLAGLGAAMVCTRRRAALRPTQSP